MANPVQRVSPRWYRPAHASRDVEPICGRPQAIDAPSSIQDVTRSQDARPQTRRADRIVRLVRALVLDRRRLCQTTDKPNDAGQSLP
jgi:hypothetical protein